MCSASLQTLCDCRVSNLKQSCYNHKTPVKILAVSKRQMTGAVQKLAHTSIDHGKRLPSWTAAVLCRFSFNSKLRSRCEFLRTGLSG